MRARPVLLAASLVVLIGVAIVIVLTGGEKHTAGTPEPGSPSASVAGPGCSDDVIVFVATDDQMRALAEVLRRDPRVRQLSTETKQQAWERFKRTFASQPNLISLARPEALPASIFVLPRAGLTSKDLAAQLAIELKNVDEVRAPQVPC